MAREYLQINVLIPGYSIEDIPSDLSESAATSLLNAFSIAWHPRVLRASQSIPDAMQAETTELPTGQNVVIVPRCSEDWLEHDWQDRLADTFSLILSDCGERDEWLRLIDERFEPSPDLSAHIIEDFLAFGTAWLQVTVLSRRMHHYVDPDRHQLETEALAAADAAVAGDDETAKKHLQRCFDLLLECREMFYPVECYLIDLCLPSGSEMAAQLLPTIQNSRALSIACTGSELRSMLDTNSGLRAVMQEAIDEQRLSLLVCHQHELRVSSGGLAALWSDIAEGLATVNSLLSGASPHWCRRRFGMTSSLPAVLRSLGIESGLHIALDDGMYPDREYGQLRWQAADGSELTSTSRIPLAIDGAASFMRFADRMTESMQDDANGTLLLARLPTVSTPWLSDLQRATSYAPVLGRFATFQDFAAETAGQGSTVQFNEGEYLSPHLIQSSVLKTELPVSSPATIHLTRHELTSARFIKSLCTLLRPVGESETGLAGLEERLNAEEARRLDGTGQESHADSAAADDVLTAITSAVASSAEEFAQTLSTPADGVDGLLLLNPLPWRRRTSVVWPHQTAPAESAFIRQCWKQADTIQLECEVPAGGFAWLTTGTASRAAVTPRMSTGKALAEGLILRNEFFEVELSDVTGGIAAVRYHNQRANRVSQQISFRYETSKTVAIDEEEIETSYAVTRLISSRIITPGPWLGVIETTCEITDPVTSERLCQVRQTTRVERSSPRIRIHVQFEDVATLPAGNPWMTYFAARFAWDNEMAAVTRSVLGQACGFRMERFEAPDFIEVADSDQRLLILPHGRPYHRRTGRRMLDSLLIVEGEAKREFDFTLDFDQPLPMTSAAEVAQPVIEHPTHGLQPKQGDNAWILGLSAKNIFMARIHTETQQSDGTWRMLLLLEETDGRAAACRIHTARPPVSARERRYDGSTVTELPVQDGTTLVEFTRFQIKLVELTF